jgi:predicted ABC-type transport system involved in lysophospholipase L1 biosynthesis ATPase subunit
MEQNETSTDHKPSLKFQQLNRQVQDRWLWRALNVEIYPGDRIAIKGASGVGKSLLLRTIAGLESVQMGQILFEGRPLPTQLIGEAVRQRADADRILYPSWLTLVLPDSAIPRLENLALFMDPEDGSRARNKQVSIDIYDPTGLIP